MRTDDEPRAGTARSALRHRAFRRVFTGMFASNIGTWMQSMVVSALAYDLTRDPWFVGMISFASFLPALFLSLVGGAIADRYDRRRVIELLSWQQLAGAGALAWVTQDPTPSRAVLLLIVLAIGCGAALQAPVFGALAPTLVPRRDIPGVMSLNMASWNGSRVVGPALGGLVYAQVGAPPVFLANAVSFIVVIAAVRRLPAADSARRESPGPRELLLGGFSILRADRVARTAIVTMVVYTTCCLVHVVQLPLLADRHLGIASRSTTFGLFFAMLGLGATAGALSISTVFAGRRLHLVARGMLGGFAVSLAALAVVRSAALAFPVLLLSGLCYFGSTVAMSTVYQSRLDDRTRGRGSAMWLLSATGTAPIATLLGAWLIDVTSLTTVMLAGSGVALGLVWYADLSPGRGVATHRG